MADSTVNNQESLALEGLRFAAQTLRRLIEDRIHKINDGQEFSNEFLMGEIDSLVKASVTVALVDAQKGDK
tara:strand:+ start:599 stop:811 length:213 start_codon:yes stop_codon:yes gene_type:complete